MNLLQTLIGQIPEAIFFALFLIFAKQLKEKRVVFTSIMVVDYVLLLNLLPYNIWSQLLYIVLTYLNLKILYRERAQITDIFTFTIASILVIVMSAISYIIVASTIKNIICATILCKILMFLFLYLFRNKLYKITCLYKKTWNRYKNKTKIKSTTFRSMNIIIFNIMFYIIHLGMIYGIAHSKGGV